MGFLAGLDTLPWSRAAPRRDRDQRARRHGGRRAATCESGPAAVSHVGITLRVAPPGSPSGAEQTGGGQGVLAVSAGATVQEVAAGSARRRGDSQEIASVFEALRQVGARNGAGGGPVSAIDPTKPRAKPSEAARGQRAKLRKAAHQLEGVFLSHLFQAMRESVPQNEDTSMGQEMFTSMLDDQLASRAADQLHRGLGEALYRQLSRRLPTK